jgi:hypothetical protein
VITASAKIFYGHITDSRAYHCDGLLNFVNLSTAQAVGRSGSGYPESIGKSALPVNTTGAGRNILIVFCDDCPVDRKISYAI